MPQEHFVLRCFSCGTFQVHIVKKVNKWQCKICNAKQSVKRNYGKGSGKDCRSIVMKLNELRMTKDVDVDHQLENELGEKMPSDELKPQNYEGEKITTSKWSEYLDEKKSDDVEEDENEEIFVERFNYGKKRKVNAKPLQRNNKKKFCTKTDEKAIMAAEKEFLSDIIADDGCHWENKKVESHPGVKEKNIPTIKYGKYSEYLEEELKCNDMIHKESTDKVDDKIYTNSETNNSKMAAKKENLLDFIHGDVGKRNEKFNGGRSVNNSNNKTKLGKYSKYLDEEDNIESDLFGQFFDANGWDKKEECTRDLKIIDNSKMAAKQERELDFIESLNVENHSIILSKNKTEQSKYSKYLEEDELQQNKDLLGNVSKRLNIFGSDETNLDDILNF